MWAMEMGLNLGHGLGVGWLAKSLRRRIKKKNQFFAKVHQIQEYLRYFRQGHTVFFVKFIKFPIFDS